MTEKHSKTKSIMKGLRITATYLISGGIAITLNIDPITWGSVIAGVIEGVRNTIKFFNERNR